MAEIISSTIEWPNIQPPSYGTTIDVEDTSIKSTFEDGTVQARRKFTKSRKTWVLKWENLPMSDYLTLMDFLQNRVYFSAIPFHWNNPIDRKTYLVRYADKEAFETKMFSQMSGSITLQEV